MRMGIGYDVHALVPDRALIIGGVALDHPLGLAGHSDADVLAHAIADAVLGAAAMGDIGQHFPDSDPRYAGADSLTLLAEVVQKVRAAGFSLVNIDATVMAQRPKLAPHIPAMRAALSQAMGLALSEVSVKATTTEKLGFVGREEGIAALAVASLERGSLCLD